MRIMEERPQSFDPAALFGALADYTRLRLLNLIGEDEVCVCYLVDVLGTNQPKVSRHLAYLRKVGVVSARREGKWMHYRIVQPHTAEAGRILSAVMDSISKQPQMKADRKRLTELLREPNVIVQLARAPRPALTERAAG
ncbi:MAG TPA: metalloregulator ArsR/SmtB family transcription factor [Blastocatellia bacterium]|nr:metalloregulator ArsR/SmtB family transcription factor [Blastocatellia bacterium]